MLFMILLTFYCVTNIFIRPMFGNTMKPSPSRLRIASKSSPKPPASCPATVRKFHGIPYFVGARVVVRLTSHRSFLTSFCRHHDDHLAPQRQDAGRDILAGGGGHYRTATGGRRRRLGYRIARRGGGDEDEEEEGEGDFEEDGEEEEGADDIEEEEEENTEENRIEDDDAEEQPRPHYGPAVYVIRKNGPPNDKAVVMKEGTNADAELKTRL